MTVSIEKIPIAQPAENNGEGIAHHDPMRYLRGLSPEAAHGIIRALIKHPADDVQAALLHYANAPYTKPNESIVSDVAASSQQPAT